ncbi:hypothetical protein RJD24_11880 [Bacillaceae bacterium IKA-2]|nr:hypothetical protein RJD24_11880 [Bacillaceae bacterium IKA-2]
MKKTYNPSLVQHINHLQIDHHLQIKKDRLIGINNHLKTYCSIQIINEAEEIKPLYVADRYFQWLATKSKRLIRVQYQENTYKLYFCLINKPLLTFTLKEADNTVAVFWISDGLLARKNQKGTFSFLRSENGKAEFIIALEQFKTSLPWFLYRITQAPIHEIVMSQYQKKKE